MIEYIFLGETFLIIWTSINKLPPIYTLCRVSGNFNITTCKPLLEFVNKVCVLWPRELHKYEILPPSVLWPGTVWLPGTIWLYLWSHMVSWVGMCRLNRWVWAEIQCSLLPSPLLWCQTASLWTVRPSWRVTNTNLLITPTVYQKWWFGLIYNN